MEENEQLESEEQLSQIKEKQWNVIDLQNNLVPRADVSLFR